jgi:hypothetical protein
MKKLGLLTVAVTLGLLGLSSGSLRAANTSNMVMSIQFSGIISKTTTVTNGGTVTSTLTTTALKIANSDILTLIQSEYGVIFPTGAQLGYDLEGTTGFVVIDQSGNLIQQVSTNPADGSYLFCLSNSIAGVDAQQITAGKVVETTATGNSTEVVSITQPDYGVYYNDSHNNNFHFIGLVAIKADALVTSSNTTYKSASIGMAGTGSGTLFNAKDGLHDDLVITKAKLTITGKNIVQPE